jgi:hypothetical protein
MKNCLRRVRPVVVRDCDTEPYAASAREKAIVCLSTDTRPRCNRNVRSDGNARAKRRNLGNTVDCLTVSRRLVAVTRSPESRRPPATGTHANGRPSLRIGERWSDILAQAGEAKAHTLRVI